MHLKIIGFIKTHQWYIFFWYIWQENGKKTKFCIPIHRQVKNIGNDKNSPNSSSKYSYTQRNILDE